MYPWNCHRDGIATAEAKARNTAFRTASLHLIKKRGQNAPTRITDSVGFNAGPRGFPVHSFTGDRRVFVTAEHRWTMLASLFDVAAVGLAGFVEGGGAWFAGSNTRFGGAAGMGLRLDSPRVAKGAVFRIDLVRTFADDRLPGRWVVVLGKDFVF